MVINKFDLVVIAILLVINLVFRKRIMQQKMGCLAIIVLFGLILPLCSMKLEIDKVLATRKAGEIQDAFELGYTFIKFQLYWIVGIIQIIIIRNRQQ